MDNTTIKTVNGFTIALKSFITGKDKRYITDSFLEGAEILEDGKFKMLPGKMHIAEDRAIETVVVSVDGTSVNKTLSVIDQVIALPLEDFEEVIKAVNAVTESKKKETNTPKI